MAPCANVQRAVNLAQSGDVILVAEGTYTYVPGLDPCASDNTGVVCIVNKTLVVRGGYDGSSWSAADAVLHPTIIDGQNTIRGILVTRSHPGAPAASLTLEGFTVRNGRIQGAVGANPDGANGRGGGVKAALCDITLRDVVLEDNLAMGGVTTSGAGGSGVGGGLFVATTPELQATVVLERVDFLRNEGRGATGPDRGGLAEGGGMFMNYGSLMASDVRFEDNVLVSGNSSGGGVAGGLRADALGGGLALLSGVEADLRGLVATGNSASGGDADNTSGVAGGAFGGGVYVEGSSLTLTEADIRDNSATGGDASKGGLGAGGGLMSFDADVVVNRCQVIGNRASGGTGTVTKGSAGGGGAYLERAFDPAVSAAMTNCVVADNLVELGAGGGTVGGGGGGLFVLGNEATLTHLTLARNALSTSPLAGQALTVVPRAGNPSHADLSYSIVASHNSVSNVAAVQVQTDASILFDSNLFAANERDTNQGFGAYGTFDGEETNLTAMDAGFVAPGSPSFDYRLASGSAAADEAVGSTEVLDFEATRRGPLPDLGADELCTAAEEDLVVAEETVVGSDVRQACRTLTASTVTVHGGGNLTLQAGRTVVLESGFQVLSGGTLLVIDVVP